MGFRIPTFADLPSDDPRAVGGLPNFPKADAGAEGLAVLGKGVQQAGVAALDIAADQRLKRDKLEETYATADAKDQISQLTFAVKNETDSGKVTELRKQMRSVITGVAGRITDPARRGLWTANHLPMATIGEEAADQRGLDIWRGHYAAGINEKINNAGQRAAQTDNPDMHQGVSENIAELVGAGVAAGVIHPDKAPETKRKAGVEIVTGHADWLDANGRAQEALGFVQRNKTRLPPDKLASLSHRLEGRADHQVGQGLADRVRGAGSGDAVEHFLDLAERDESGSRNIRQQVVGPNGGYNPSVGRVTGPSSAQGYFQITNTTWGEFAPQAGVDVAQYPNAMSAPYKVQRQVARTIATTSGVQHWTDYNKNLRVAVQAAGLPVSGPIAGAPSAAGIKPAAEGDAKLRNEFWAYNKAHPDATLSWDEFTKSRGGGVIDENTDPALSAKIDAAPAAGEPIPLDGPAKAGSASAVPDLEQQLRDIEADPNASQKQKDFASAIVSRDWHRQKAALSAATRQESAAVNALIKDDEASIATTGQPIAELTPERVAASQGQDKADEFAANRATAHRYYEQTHDFENLPQAEIDQRLDAMKPGPGQVGFARNLKAYEAAGKLADNLAKLRATDPAASVAGLSDVAAAGKGASLAKPETFGPLVMARMLAMDRIGIPAENRVPITRGEALQLWQPIGLANRGGDPREVKTALTGTVQRVQAAFGEHAQIALGAVLREGKADHDTAGIAAAIVRKLARNEPPTDDEARRLDNAQKSDAAAVAVAPIYDPASGIAMTPLPAPAAPGRRYPAPDGAAIAMLRASPETAANFDAVYGPGQAQKALKIAPARSAR